MYKELLLAALAISTAPTASAQLLHPLTYCVDKGGLPRSLTMLDNQDQPTLYSKTFCRLEFPGEGRKFVAPETLLSWTKTLVWEHLHKGRPPEIVIDHERPAAAYCDYLGGLHSYWRDETDGDFGICAFVDGSLASDWLLFQKASALPTTAAAFLYKEYSH